MKKKSLDSQRSSEGRTTGRNHKNHRIEIERRAQKKPRSESQPPNPRVQRTTRKRGIRERRNVPVHTTLIADRRRSRSRGPVTVATRRMSRGSYRKHRHSQRLRTRQGSKNRAQQQHCDHAQAGLHLCPGNFNAKFFRKPLPNLLRQAVMHAPRPFFCGIKNRHRRRRSHRHAQPDQR